MALLLLPGFDTILVDGGRTMSRAQFHEKALFSSTQFQRRLSSPLVKVWQAWSQAAQLVNQVCESAGFVTKIA
jgi:hypothetical protein